MNAVEDKAPESDIELLLPWHAAGTLDRRDAQQVEHALANDPALAERYALVREEMAETIHFNESLGAPSPHAMQKLFAAIDAEPARRPARRGIGTRLSDFFGGLTPRTLAWSGSVALVAIVLQAGLIADLVLHEAGPERFQTASAPLKAPLRAPLRSLEAGVFAYIRFTPQASIADINAFLEANELSIVAGPTSGGLYTVRIADQALPKTQVDYIINRLHADKVVNFVGTAK
jgi:anti-sigma factor RsiW